MLRKLSLVSSFLLVLSLTAPGAQKPQPALQHHTPLSFSDRPDSDPPGGEPLCWNDDCGCWDDCPGLLGKLKQ